MFKISSKYGLPDNSDQMIWRYMKLGRFEEMLEKRSLYFASRYQLKDKLEFEHALTNFDHGVLPPNQNNHLNAMKTLSSTVLQPYIKINCWHVSEEQSCEMWKEYVGDKIGVVIQSTFKKLSRSFQNFPYDVTAGMVQYNPLSSLSGMSGADLILHKDARKFSHEKELRFYTNHKWIPPGRPPLGMDSKTGVYVEFEIQNVLEKVIVSSKGSSSDIKNIKSIMEKIPMDIEIETSKLY